MNPHFGHLYKRPNLRHFPSRLIWISPQFGQRNFVDSLPGGIGLPQLVQVTKDSVVALSVIIYISCASKCKSYLYLLCSPLPLNRCFLRLYVLANLKFNCTDFVARNFQRQLRLNHNSDTSLKREEK